MIHASISNIDLNKSLADIKKYNQATKKGIWNAIETTVRTIAYKAQVNLKTNKSYQTGRLSSSLQKDIKLNKPAFSGKVGSPLEYASYVEFGTPPHIIEVKTKKVLARYTGTTGGKAGFQIFGKRVNHPGSKAKPYLFPAVESERKKFEQRIKKVTDDTRSL